jgi:DNA-binding NarL/FixJ family response regulator
MTKPRIVLADDHPIVLAGLRKLVEERCEVVAAVEDGRALVAAVERLKPDLVVLDISMPLLNGFDAAIKIRKALPGVKLLFLTMHSSPSYATEAFKAGADGYLLKQSAASELVPAIDAVMKGLGYITPAMTKSMLSTMLNLRAPRLGTGVGGLSPRQREVLQLVAEGKTAKQIALLLNVSVKTVDFHKNRIMQQLGLHSTPELVRFAIAEGLVSAEP